MATFTTMTLNWVEINLIWLEYEECIQEMMITFRA